LLRKKIIKMQKNEIENEEDEEEKLSEDGGE
jgi:hypothetical protein